jgi:hypothetical protein
MPQLNIGNGSQNAAQALHRKVSVGYHAQLPFKTKSNPSSTRIKLLHLSKRQLKDMGDLQIPVFLHKAMPSINPQILIRTNRPLLGNLSGKQEQAVLSIQE